MNYPETDDPGGFDIADPAARKVVNDAATAMRSGKADRLKVITEASCQLDLVTQGEAIDFLSEIAINDIGLDTEAVQCAIAKGQELRGYGGGKAKKKGKAGNGKSDDIWRNNIQKTITGSIIPNVNNTLLVLENEPDVADRFSFNEMSLAVMVGRAIGGDRHDLRAVSDGDVTEVQRWLQVHGNLRVSSETVLQAIKYRAEEASYHPIKDYLKALKWDGVPRLASWLHEYLGADPSEYHAAIGTMFPISMVVRILKPGCKVDHMPVLEGNQGTMKSTACRVLAGDEFFSDNLPDLESKDSSQHLRGKWLVEVAEMHAFDRAESSRLKSYITRQEERYRPSHGKLEVFEPRQCVFIGTTNKSVYLKDETGGRRFWPVKTGAIDINGLRSDRDQLFAEAVALFNSGAPWWPDVSFEQRFIKPQQDERYDADFWEEKIVEWTERRSGFTTGEVAKEALFLEIPKIGTRDQNRISGILVNLGFNRGKRASGGRRPWVRA
jgi:predicted P-loop ATPase